MQRGLDAEAKKQLEEEEKRIISDEHWYLDLPELKAKEYGSHFAHDDLAIVTISSMPLFMSSSVSAQFLDHLCNSCLHAG